MIIAALRNCSIDDDVAYVQQVEERRVDAGIEQVCVVIILLATIQGVNELLIHQRLQWVVSLGGFQP